MAPAAGAHGKVPRLILFGSPSHNIGCAMDSTSVRCDIAEHDWVAPPKPKRCDLDWGNGLAVGRAGKASFVCAGDTTLHQGHVLAYGRSKHLGTVGCTSLRNGMRCVNHKTGHGFLLSRAKARRF